MNRTRPPSHVDHLSSLSPPTLRRPGFLSSKLQYRGARHPPFNCFLVRTDISVHVQGRRSRWWWWWCNGVLRPVAAAAPAAVGRGNPGPLAVHGVVWGDERRCSPGLRPRAESSVFLGGWERGVSFPRTLAGRGCFFSPPRTTADQRLARGSSAGDRVFCTWRSVRPFMLIGVVREAGGI